MDNGINFFPQRRNNNNDLLDMIRDLSFRLMVLENENLKIEQKLEEIIKYLNEDNNETEKS